jgi:hypothetical protein
VSIRDRQVKQAVSRILHQELQKGKYPSMRTIARRIKEYFQKHTPGLPTFRFRPAQSRGTSNPHDYNQMLDEIYDDLHMVFSETNDQTRRLIANFDFGEVERNRLISQLQKLEDRIDHLLLLAEDTDGYLAAVYDDFRDFSKINKAETTADIDLNTNEVVLRQVRSGGTRYNLEKANVTLTLLTPNAKMETIQPIENAIDDYLNTAWVSKVSVPEAQPVAVEIKIALTDKTNNPNDKFADEVFISCIEYIDHSPTPTMVSAFWSNDDINYFPLKENQRTVEVKGATKWLFDAIPMQYIKLRLEKTEPDETTDNAAIYRFGARNINVSQLGFIDQGRLVSKPLKIKEVDTINQVALDVDADVPAHTKIDYYIMLPQVSKDILHPISPISDPNPQHSKVINLSNLTTPEPLVVTGTGKKVSTYHGIDFYEITTLPHVPLKGSVRLYRGRNMWQKEHAVTDYFTNRDRNHIPKMADWVNLPPDIDETRIPTALISADNTKLPVESGAGVMCKFTTNVLCDDATVINGNLNASNCKVTIMVNGKEVDLSDGNYTLRLKSGWNKIDVLTYNPGSNQPFLDLGFNICNFGTKILAERAPLIETSYYNLQNNVLMKDHTKFAVNGSQLIVNHNTADIEFEVIFTYSASSTVKDEIVLIAELSRENSKTSLSPRLKSYRLKIS